MLQRKTAADQMMGAAAASPIPTPQISTLAAPKIKRGPTGMAPMVSNSRVNTGVAPAMDAGASDQKSVAPMGASMLQAKTASRHSEDRMGTMMGRPSVQEMIKAAVEGTAARLNLNAEAHHQMKLASEGSPEDRPLPAPQRAQDEKTASTHVEKLAAALDYAALCVKEGSVGPGEGPNALHVMESPGGATISHSSGQAIPKNIPPVNPPMQNGLTGSHGGGTSLMKNDLDHAPGGPGHQRTALPGDHGSKTAAPISLILAKTAALKKKAEDAINPARISAGKTVAPDTRESGQAGPSSPQGSSMVGSSESVTNLTRRQAKAAPKAEMKAYIDQPALSAEHDHILQNAFSHTNQAGAKIAAQESADAVIKTAAVRAYLEQLVDEVKNASGGH